MKTKERILFTARDLIYKQGYSATSVNDILESASVGKGQFYYYFTSKEDIAKQVIQMNINEWRFYLLNDILAPSDNPKEDFLKMIQWFSREIDNTKIFHGCHIGNLIVEFSTKNEKFRLMLEKLMLDFADLLAKKLMDLSPKYSNYDEAYSEAKFIIATIQGNVILLKVTQNANVLKENLKLLELKYLNS